MLRGALNGDNARDVKLPSDDVKSFAPLPRKTVATRDDAAVTNVENGTSSAREIFHSRLMVGVLCPSSICPSIARLTPDARAKRSSDKPRLTRKRRRLAPTIGVRSPSGSVGGGGESEIGVGLDKAFREHYAHSIYPMYLVD